MDCFSLGNGKARLARLRQLAQKTDPDAGRFLRAMYEAIEPLGMFGHDLSPRTVQYRPQRRSAVPGLVVRSSLVICKSTSSQIAAANGQHHARDVRGFIRRKKEDRRHLFVECGVAS